MRTPFLLFLCALLAASVSAQPYEAGRTYFGRAGYIEYRAGDLPLIITAGHGGDQAPAEIPDRTDGVFATDTNTRELAIACFDELVARTGLRPHLVISHLTRRKLDPNRPLAEAAGGDPLAAQAWREFHGFIAAARASAEAAHGVGLVVDLHGHGHPIQRLELGYNLGAPELNLSDAQLNRHPSYGWHSSLRTLVLSKPGVPFASLLRGPGSLGDLFDLEGIPAWPSPRYPNIGEAPFFRGGHITRAHTCFTDDGPIAGVQIESHFRGVRDTPEARAAFARTFASVFITYLKNNYNFIPAAADDAGCSDGCAAPAPAAIVPADSDPLAPSVHLEGAPAGNLWHDSSPRGLHATTLPAGAGPAASTDDAGRPAALFDGLHTTAALPRFNLGPGGAFTTALSFRLQPLPDPARHTLLAHGSGDSLLVHLALDPSSARPVLRTRLPGLSAEALDVKPPRFNRPGWQDDRWHHYALTVDAAGTARVYLDGRLRATATGVAPLAPDRLIWLGWKPGPAPAPNFLRGALADVRLYPRSLPASEITRLSRRR